MWMLFAAAALTRTADPENHEKSCINASKFADEMSLQFANRFDKKEEEKFDYPDSPTFDHVGYAEHQQVPMPAPVPAPAPAPAADKEPVVDKELDKSKDSPLGVTTSEVKDAAVIKNDKKSK
jgi:hypothetical protein